MTKEGWKTYYTHLLDSNLITVEWLKEKYEDYEQHREDWIRSDSRGSYENGQEALLEILEEHKGDKKMSTLGNILIWNKAIGFIQIHEGTGDNLLDEDEEGYVDYIMVDGYSFNGYELEEDDSIVESSQAMLTELYQEKFNTVEGVIEYLIEEGFIPDVDYTVLYAE